MKQVRNMTKITTNELTDVVKNVYIAMTGKEPSEDITKRMSAGVTAAYQTLELADRVDPKLGYALRAAVVAHMAEAMRVPIARDYLRALSAQYAKEAGIELGAQKAPEYSGGLQGLESLFASLGGSKTSGQAAGPGYHHSK